MLGIIGVIDLSKYNFLSYFPVQSEQDKIENTQNNDGILLVLLSAIALTSTVWTSFQFLLQNQLNTIVAIAFAATIGKIFGGIFAQRWGWRRYTIASLIIAAFLLFYQPNNLTLILGLALLQSSIPVTLTATAKIMPQQPATATGFALGLAIIIGGIPVIVGLSDIIGTPAISVLTIAVVALSLDWVLKSKIMI
jgi:FSR family fosmidomycin resistance protein-like MFS transporter